MLRKSKKILAVILSVLTLFVMLSVAAGAVATKAEETYPVVYISGYSGNLYTDKYDINSEKIYPTGVDIGARVKEALVPCLAELALGAATDNYDSYCDALYEAVAPIYDDLRLNPDGTVKDNSGNKFNPESNFGISYAKYDCGEVYVYHDWRISPLTLAEELDVIINKVIAKTGKDKVNLLGRCFGSNVVSSYIQIFGSEKVNKAVYYVPSTLGIGLIGSIFSGHLDINAKNIDLYVQELTKYENIIEDGMIKDFINVMLSIFEQASILDFGVDALDKLLDKISSNLIPRLVRTSYGSFPSFWSMVPDEYFADALEFVYNTDELKEEYAGTIDLITAYHDEVQKNAFDSLQSGAVESFVISKYNLPSAPLFGRNNPNSDAVAEVKYTSFGATAAEYGTSLTEDYIAAMPEEALAFLSPDEKIDASTCAVPERTWFIKNSYHDHFPESIDRLINKMLTTDGFTVFDEEYPQFLDADVTAENLKPVTEKDEDIPKPGSSDEKFTVLFNFIKFVIKLIVELFGKLSVEA